MGLTDHGPRIPLAAVILFAAVGCSTKAQDTGSGSSSSAKPAAPPADAQAGTSAEKKKPLKVWTNEEIGSVKGNVSVVGDPDPSSGKTADKKLPTATIATQLHQTRIRNYRKQILELQAQINAIDKRVAQLKNFKGENASPSGGLVPYQSYNMIPIEEQVKQLEGKKKQLQAKIEDVENDARKNGIDPGELR